MSSNRTPEGNQARNLIGELEEQIGELKGRVSGLEEEVTKIPELEKKVREIPRLEEHLRKCEAKIASIHKTISRRGKEGFRFNLGVLGLMIAAVCIVAIFSSITATQFVAGALSIALVTAILRGKDYRALVEQVNELGLAMSAAGACRESLAKAKDAGHQLRASSVGEEDL